MTDLSALAERIRRRWFRRKPDWKTLAGSYESAFAVMERKSLWMVEYLRGRRTNDSLTGFYREQHLVDRLRARSQGGTDNG